MINVVCSLWGDKYSDSYVHHLKESCHRNLLHDFSFSCITDRTIDGIDCYDPPNPHTWCKDTPLWDSVKLYYFQENFLNKSGDFLSLDLDTIFIDDIDLSEYNRPTIIYKKWKLQKEFDHAIAIGKTNRTMINSSIMFWKQNSMVDYFNKYKNNEEEHNLIEGGSDNYHQFVGNYNWSYFDQHFTYSYAFGCDVNDQERGKYRPFFLSVIFNGDSPMIDQCDNWVKDYWYG